MEDKLYLCFRRLPDDTKAAAAWEDLIKSIYELVKTVSIHFLEDE